MTCLEPRPVWTGWLCLCVVIGWGAPVASGQTGARDDDAPVSAEARAEVGDRESIGFTQENVAAQMAELEERMFRLSEALQSLEPENASRLRLALNFAREELILQQMRETRELLIEAQLNDAETEVKELLAKLEHLRQLLIAEDLDFQMKLARLRQLREAIGELDQIITEERRELAWSRSAIEGQERLNQLKNRYQDLKALVDEQASSVERLEAGETEGTGVRQAEARQTAAELAEDPLFVSEEPRFLAQADPELEDVGVYLDAGETGNAAASARAALKLFQAELERLETRIAEQQEAIAPAEFETFARDQARNRERTERLATVSARLGNTGVALQKGLIRAGAAMDEAETELIETEAQPAAEDQQTALKHLGGSRDELGAAIESLLTELRGELQARLNADLTEMLEIQTSIRERTEAQASRIAQGSRTARLQVAGMAEEEHELVERTEQLAALAEETEFGIALPTALRVVAHTMSQVEARLERSDASEQTIELERRVEEDLLGLLEAMRRLPTSSPPPPGPLPSDLRARLRELNRLVAELKMIRMLQTRLNEDTVEFDQTRPEDERLAPELRRQIETLHESQRTIRDTLSRLKDRLQ